MTEPDVLAVFKASIVDRTCLAERWEHSWPFVFGTRGLDWGCTIVVTAPWRVITDGRITCSGEDDGQRFGRSEPLDALLKANSVLGGKRVLEIGVDLETADIRVEFDGGTRLDIFNMSSGYEGWIASFDAHGVSFDLIATGGGELNYTSSALDPGTLRFGRRLPKG